MAEHTSIAPLNTRQRSYEGSFNKEGPIVDKSPLDPQKGLSLQGVLTGEFERKPKSDMNFADTLNLLAAKLKNFNIMSEDSPTEEMGNIMEMEMMRKAMETQNMQMLMSILGNKDLELVVHDKNNKEVIGAPTAILPGKNGQARVIINGEEYHTEEMAGAKLKNTQLPKSSNTYAEKSTEPTQCIPDAPPAPTAEYLNSQKPLLNSIKDLAPKPQPANKNDIAHIYS